MVPALPPGGDLRQLFPLLDRLAPELVDVVRADPRRMGRLETGRRVVVPGGPGRPTWCELLVSRVEVDRLLITVLDVTEERRLAAREHEIAVELRPDDTADDLYRRFEARHKELYGTALGHKVVVVTLRTAIVGRVAPIELERHAPGSGTEPPVARHAHVHPHAEPIPVTRRPALDAGMVVPGPALIEEVDSVHYLPPGCCARVDEWLLFVQNSPSGQGGRGLGAARVFDRGGRLVASIAQEGMVRVPLR